MGCTALEKFRFLFIDFNGNLDSATHMVNVYHGQATCRPYFGDFGTVTCNLSCEKCRFLRQCDVKN